MKHNNVMPNAHFKKHWDNRVRTWFNQPGRKVRRRNTRQAKAAALAPAPVKSLRPSVRCPTIRYNMRLRSGRGFTKAELDAVKVSTKYAQTIGIAVDARRRNKSVDSFNRNVERLQAYLAKLKVFKGEDKIEGNFAAAPAPVTNEKFAVEFMSLADVPKTKQSAFHTVRGARLDAKLVGIRMVRKAKAAEAAAIAAAKKSKKK